MSARKPRLRRRARLSSSARRANRRNTPPAGRCAAPSMNGAATGVLGASGGCGGLREVCAVGASRSSASLAACPRPGRPKSSAFASERRRGPAGTPWSGKSEVFGWVGKAGHAGIRGSALEVTTAPACSLSATSPRSSSLHAHPHQWRQGFHSFHTSAAKGNSFSSARASRQVG